MASYLSLVILIGAILYGYLSHTLRNNLIRRYATIYSTRRDSSGLCPQKRLPIWIAMPPSLARTAGKEIKARVSIIRRDGKVAGDSELTDTELRKLENHANRPEFITGNEHGQGLATRFSATLGTNMIYTALPFQTTSGQPGVIRLALPLSRIDAAMTSLGTILGASLILAVILLSYSQLHALFHYLTPSPKNGFCRRPHRQRRVQITHSLSPAVTRLVNWPKC